MYTFSILNKFRAFLLFSLCLTTTSWASTRQNYVLNPDHSQLFFSLSYLSVSQIHGSFQEFEGELSLDAQNRPHSVAITIKASSIFTNDNKRDHHLKKEDFFWVTKHPAIYFESAKIISLDEVDSVYQVHGTLLFQEREYAQSFQARLLGIKQDPWGKWSHFYEFQGQLNRRELGLRWNRLLDSGETLLGDEINVRGTFQFQPRGQTTAFSTHMVPGPRAGSPEEGSTVPVPQNISFEALDSQDLNQENALAQKSLSEQAPDKPSRARFRLLGLLYLGLISLSGLILMLLTLRQWIQEKWPESKFKLHLGDGFIMLLSFLFALAIEVVTRYD
jgi:polyisoprenoid-binding protein YceI